MLAYLSSQKILADNAACLSDGVNILRRSPSLIKYVQIMGGDSESFCRYIRVD
jgi:hypothetical protein